MPTRGSPRHAFRFTPDLWRAFNDAVERDPQGRDVAHVVRDLVSWYARRKPGDPVRAPKPPRRDL